jgi:hypothetical protein
MKSLKREDMAGFELVPPSITSVDLYAFPTFLTEICTAVSDWERIVSEWAARKDCFVAFMQQVDLFVDVLTDTPYFPVLTAQHALAVATQNLIRNRCPGMTRSTAYDRMSRIAEEHVALTDSAVNACASFAETNSETFYGLRRTDTAKVSAFANVHRALGVVLGESQMLLLLCHAASLIKAVFHVNENMQFSAARSLASVPDTRHLDATCTPVDRSTQYDDPEMMHRFMSVDLFKRVPVTIRNQFDDALDAARRAADDASRRYQV